jgi:hypothetical protein
MLMHRLHHSVRPSALSAASKNQQQKVQGTKSQRTNKATLSVTSESSAAGVATTPAAAPATAADGRPPSPAPDATGAASATPTSLKYDNKPKEETRQHTRN